MKNREIPTFTTNEFFEKRHEYCIGIPLLNEGEKIIKQLKKMQDAKIQEHADIIIFDGGSTDEATNKELLTSLNVRCLLVKTGPGKQGAQFRMGFHYILEQGYKGIVTIDGNNKDSVEHIPNFITKLKQGYDFIQGSRFIKGGFHENTPLSRLIAVKLIHSPWISILGKFRYTDTTNAFRGISRKLLESERISIFRSIFNSYELLFYMSIMAPKSGFKTSEIPVERKYPKAGKTPTKINFLGNFKIIGILIKLSWECITRIAKPIFHEGTF